MQRHDASEERVQVEIPREVLSRLLRERSLVASEIQCLNAASFEAARQALLLSLKT